MKVTPAEYSIDFKLNHQLGLINKEFARRHSMFPTSSGILPVSSRDSFGDAEELLVFHWSSTGSEDSLKLLAALKLGRGGSSWHFKRSFRP